MVKVGVRAWIGVGLGERIRIGCEKIPGQERV